MFVIISLIILRFRETRGHYPFFKAKASTANAGDVARSSSNATGSDDVVVPESKAAVTEKTSEAHPAGNPEHAV